MQQTSDSKLVFIKFARIITYLIYAYFVIATVCLIVAFFLLILGASATAGFVRFVYHFAAVFLQPFRDIFPGHQLSDRSYFSSAALFAIIIYGLAAMALHSFITYITLKQTQHQQELAELSRNATSAKRPVEAESTEEEMAGPTDRVIGGRPPRVSA